MYMTTNTPVIKQLDHGLHHDHAHGPFHDPGLQVIKQKLVQHP
jgi:hypothetical protein